MVQTRPVSAIVPTSAASIALAVAKNVDSQTDERRTVSVSRTRLEHLMTIAAQNGIDATQAHFRPSRLHDSG